MTVPIDPQAQDASAAVKNALNAKAQLTASLEDAKAKQKEAADAANALQAQLNEKTKEFNQLTSLVQVTESGLGVIQFILTNPVPAEAPAEEPAAAAEAQPAPKKG